MRKRLTSAQKARRRGRNRRGGKTRQQVLREKINEHQRYLRENNLSEPNFHVTPISKLVNQRGNWAKNDLAVYGVYKDGTKWVLTGLSATDDYERMSPDRTKMSETKVRGRHVLLPTGEQTDPDPEQGVEIKRFDTKKAALNHVSADGSNRIEPGKYVVRPKHDPRTRRAEVDADEFTRFQRRAHKVWE